MLTKTIVDYFEIKTDIKSRTMLAKYKSDCEEYKKKYNKVFNFEKILFMYKYDYVVFLTERYFSCIKRGLLKYFSKYKIAFYDYRNKHIIQNCLNMLAEYLKMPNEKYEIIKENYLLNNFKIIYFLDNSIEPGLLYKKIAFSKEELFLSINNYIIKRLEYKLRTFCQIAEKLGAETIQIKSASDTKNIDKINIGVKAQQAEFEVVSKEMSSSASNINLIFKYTNFNLNLNLNKYYLTELIDNETEFFISRDEFSSDIDLKFLIDSRCIGLIQKYSTEIIVKNINEIERKILIKAMGYGLDLGHSHSKSEYTSLSIDIDFIDIYKKPECITGYNLYIGKEGFWHLANIITEIKNQNKLIQENDVYYKIHNFMKSHLTSLSKKQFEINKVLLDNPLQIYNNIIANFKKSDIQLLYYELFNDNMAWGHFEKIRNDILFNSTNQIQNNSEIVNKFYFIISQYHLITNNNKIFLDKINSFIETNWQNILSHIFEDIKLMKLIENKISVFSLNDILQLNKKEITNIILLCIENSYLKWYGLETLKTQEEIWEMLIHAIRYNFEKTFENILCDITKRLSDTHNKIHISLSPSEEYMSEVECKKAILDIVTEIDARLLDNDEENQSIIDELVSEKEKLNYKLSQTPRKRRRSLSKTQESIKNQVIEIMNNIMSIIIYKISTEIGSNTIYHNNLYIKKYMAHMYIQYIDQSISFRKKFKDVENEFIESIETYVKKNETDNNYQINKIFYTWDNFLHLVYYIGKYSKNTSIFSKKAIDRINQLDSIIIHIDNNKSSSFRASFETADNITNIPTPMMPSYDDYKESPSISPSNSKHSVVVEYELCG